MKERVFFITGGAGFIASAFIERIIENNKVVVFDSFARNSLKDKWFVNHKNLTVIQGDILNYSQVLNSLPENCDYVLHLAAIAGIDTVIKEPVKTMEVNMFGTYNILKAILEKNLIKRLERFIDFSTSEVFGVTAFRVDEKASTNLQPVGEARWTYSVSKLAGEHLAHAYYKQYGLKAVTIRPFNVYGPGQVGEGAIHRFVVRAINDEPLEIHGDGDQIRSWCYIDDMVDGMMLCLEKEEAIGEVFNIGNPRGTITILGLAEKIKLLANSRSEIIFVPKNYVDVELRIPSIEKAKEKLGYSPKIDLDEGLRRTIEWYRKMKR